MGNVIIGATMLLDWFMNDRNGDVSCLYPDLEALRRTEMVQEEIRTTGAVVMGRHAYDMGEGDFTDYEYQVPIFVLTHHIPEKMTKGQNDQLTVAFVTDGIERASEKAKAVAGDKHVTVVGGANNAQQCLRAGLVDEILIGIVPVLLGEGLAFSSLSSMSRWNWKERGCSSPRREQICGSALSTNKQGRISMRKAMLSMKGTLDGNMGGAHGEIYVLPMTSNTIPMRQNGGNR